jgi:hypothetical protein
MGSSISVPSLPSFPVTGLPDSRNIYNKTQPTVDLMNRILDFVLRNADIRDMISLANPDECSKWMIIAESNLSTYFDKIQIQPGIGKDGVLYIKKLDTLKLKNDLQGCKLLALFFVRLFQVVGALSLSIVDTKIPDRKDYLESKSEEPVYQKHGVPFFKKLDDNSKKWFGGELTQTELSSISNELRVFSLYLTASATANQYYLTTIATSREKPPVNVSGFTIQINGPKLVVTYSRTSSPLLFELTPISGNKVNINVIRRDGIEYPFNENYSYAPQPRGNIMVSFNKRDIDFADFLVAVANSIVSLPPSQTMKTLQEFNYLEPSRIKPKYLKIKDIDFGIESSGIFVSEKDMNSKTPKFMFGFITKIDGKNIYVEVSFNLLIVKISDEKYSVEITDLINKTDSEKFSFKPNLNFERVETVKKDENSEVVSDTSATNNFTIKSGIYGVSSEPTNGTTTIPQWLEKKFNIIKKQALQTIELGLEQSRKGYQNPLDNSKVTDSRLKTTELWRTLLREPPVKAFCTARALQLLNISGLQKIMPKEIQPLIFNTAFDLVKDKSLPTPNGPITDAHALKALVALYEDVSDLIPTSKDKKLIPSEGMFYGSKDYRDKKKKESIGKLVASFLQTGNDINKIIDLSGDTVGKISDPKKITELRSKAIDLFNIQFEHTRKVNVLLNKLFTINNSITLNNSILSKGVRGIEEVAAEARDLLSDYYSNCQTKYNEGVKIIQRPTAQTRAPVPGAKK